MESNTNFSDFEQQIIKFQKGHRRAKVAAGLFIILFGTLFLLDRLKFPIPGYTYDWQMILIAIGITSLIRHKFRKSFGFILILVGFFFLLQSWYPKSFDDTVIWPIVIIFIGIVVLFKRKRRHPYGDKNRFSKEHWKKMHDPEMCRNINPDDFIDSTVFFGGSKKIVTSQNFIGAEFVTICGGTEVDLSNADFNERIVIDITCLFAGTTLNVPNNWQITTDVTTIFGGIEDKRPTHLVENAENKKIVVLRGLCLFGGIDITSFSS